MNGIVINIDPVIFQLGSFELRWYSLAVLAAALAVFTLAIKGAQRKGLPVQLILSLAPWVMLGGIAGARLFHVLDHLSYYRAYPAEIIHLQQGGLAVWGALIGGGAAIAIYAKARHIPLGLLMDILVPALLVGQIIGRVGCIINGDAAGGLTTLPWGLIYVHPGASISPDLQGVATHPYPVYEMLWNGAVLAVILKLRERFTREGSIFAVYLALYALGRLVLTSVRHEPVIFLGLQEAQLLAVAAWALAGTIFFRLYGHYKVNPGGAIDEHL